MEDYSTINLIELMEKLKLTDVKQSDVITHISETYIKYESQLLQRKSDMTEIYNGIRKFKEPRINPRDTTFKVNKLSEIENRILPRIMSKKPKPIVSYINPDLVDSEVDVDEMSKAVGSKLSEIFKKQDMIKSLRLLARTGLRYGVGFVRLTPKYRIIRTPEKVEDIEIDERWEEITTVKKKIEEKVSEQYTGMDIVSFADIYFDPRYRMLEDMPSVIDVCRNMRTSYFTQNPEKFMNLDKLRDCMNVDQSLSSTDYKQAIYSITGITPTFDKIIADWTLTLKRYAGYYDLSDDRTYKNEKMYEFWVLDDVILVYAKEIYCLPFESFTVFEDTETFLATGILQPILGLQDEMNWKKNRASAYVNKLLNPDYIRSPASGIDPRKINQGHGNILATPRLGQDALQNLVQMPLKELNASYFNEQNDMERQIQAASFTINTNTPITQNSLTDTATGAKIQAGETDSVTAEIRTHFEETLVRLSYKLIQYEYDNMEENMNIKSEDEDDTFYEMNKEAIRDAESKYAIEFEAGSTSTDTTEERRNDAIAQWNIWLQAAKAGVSVNLDSLYEKLQGTFPWADKKELFKQQAMLPWLAPQPWMPWAVQPWANPQAIAQSPTQEPIPMQV